MAVSNNQNMKFNKTETEYNLKSIRFLLLTITAMFIVIAGLMIVLGNSVYSHFHSYTFFYEAKKVGSYLTPSALCVFIGLAFILISIFGFFGSLKMSTCMVNVYALILTIVFVIKFVVVIVCFTMNTDTILQYIDVPVWDYNDPEIQAEVDYLQSTLGCCGSNSYMDYRGMDFTNNQTLVSITKTIDGDQVSMVLPETCCVNAGEEFCTKMWSAGCKAALVNLLIQNSTVIGLLGVSVMFINLLGIIFALLLARCIRRLKSERALLAWNAKEKIIIARQAEESQRNEENSIYINHEASSVA